MNPPLLWDINLYLSQYNLIGAEISTDNYLLLVDDPVWYLEDQLKE